MAAIKYQHSLVRPSELLSSCGWMMLFVDQPSGGRVPGFRRISQINGFSTLLPGSEKKMLTTHGCFVQKQQLIGNAYGEVLLQRAEKIFGNDTWQLCYPTSPFHSSLESGFSCYWGYCQGARHKLKESNDIPIQLACLSGHVQIQKAENIFSEL